VLWPCECPVAPAHCAGRRALGLWESVHFGLAVLPQNLWVEVTGGRRGPAAEQTGRTPGLGGGDALPACNPVFTGRAGALAEVTERLASGWR